MAQTNFIGSLDDTFYISKDRNQIDNFSFKMKNPFQNNMELVDKFLNKKFKKLFLNLFDNGSLEKILKYETLEGESSQIKIF